MQEKKWTKPAGAALLFGAAALFYGLSRSDSAPPIPSLIQALGRNDVPTLRSVLERDPSAVKQVDLSGNTPLHIAAMGGLEETVELLLKSGADPNVPNKAGLPPLGAALFAENHQASVVKKLLAGGASPDFKLPDGRTLKSTIAQFNVRDPQIATLLASAAPAGAAR